MTDAEFLNEMERRDGDLFTPEERKRLYSLAHSDTYVVECDMTILTKRIVVNAREYAKKQAIKRIKGTK
jgi:hypothetical protein